MNEMIVSLTNPKVKQWLKLKQKKYRLQTGTFLIEGEHLIQEAMDAKCLDTLIVSDHYTGGLDHLNKIVVSRSIITALCATESKSECVGIATLPMVQPWHDHILILEHIQDPGNLGTIIRSALSFGFNTIIAVDCVDHTNDKVVRSTQGALFKINYITSHDLESIYQQLKVNGYTIYATALTNASSLSSISFESKCAIVMGNEGNGLTMEATHGADHIVKIEMATFESLNVSVAASIMMYMVYQQQTGQSH